MQILTKKILTFWQFSKSLKRFLIEKGFRADVFAHLFGLVRRDFEGDGRGVRLIGQGCHDDADNKGKIIFYEIVSLFQEIIKEGKW